MSWFKRYHSFFIWASSSGSVIKKGPFGLFDHSRSADLPVLEDAHDSYLLFLCTLLDHGAEGHISFFH